MSEKHTYEVIVGNIGAVHTGHNFRKANGLYTDYVWSSKTGLGRAGHEPVTLMKDGEPHRDYMPPSEEEDEDNPLRDKLLASKRTWDQTGEHETITLVLPKPVAQYIKGLDAASITAILEDHLKRNT